MKTWGTRCLDFLIWVGVIFPIFTGGIWIRRPGLKLEHTQTAVPVLALVVLFWFYRRSQLRKGRDFSSEGMAGSFSSIVLAQKIWGAWSKAVAVFPIRTLLLGTFVSALLLMLASLRRHWAFGSGAYDLGIFTNAFWNLGHGYGLFSAPRGGIFLLTDHQSFISWILSPVFNLFPFAETLLVLQAFALAAGAIPAYFLARQCLTSKEGNHLAPWFLPAVPLLYWAYAPLRNANAFDFHPEVLMVPLALGAVAGIQSTRRWGRWAGFACLGFAFLTKETCAGVMAGISIAWILGAGPALSQSFTKRVGWIVLGFSVLVFGLDLKWVPSLYGAEHFHLKAHLGQYGEGAFALLLAPILKPGLFWKNVFGIARLKFLFFTFAPLAFLPALSGRALLAALPAYLMLFLTEGDHKVSLQYHYAIEPAVFLFWALSLGWVGAQAFKTSWIKGLGTPVAVLVFAVLFFDRSEIYRIRKFSETAQDHWLRTELISALNPVASFSASSALVPHLAARHWVSEIPRLSSDEVDGPSSQVSCILIDGRVSNTSIAPSDWDKFYKQLVDLKYQKIFQCQTTQLYQKEGGPSCLDHPLICPTSFE